MTTSSPMDPRIGQLTRRGLPVFYTYIDGMYVEGPVETLTLLLQQPQISADVLCSIPEAN